ncbi:scarecrow-like protein 28 [Cucurbita maxima]|uniref:Scarecrow-like protein 28 n=1 Tax=Cucurbita maxima TaxID=3661 RepID=A0A6J1L1V9_CUCMA|nr:scarecrow-like protein 28 [Cucurbita maxima]
MLAGCSSSTLLSPRNRLRSEAQPQFQACHLQLPTSMSTQRLDLPCSFSRPKDTSASTARSPSIRPVGLSVEKQNIRLPPLSSTNKQIKQEFWKEKGKNLKRIAEQIGIDDDENFISSAKRKRESRDDGGDRLILSQFGSGGGSFWFHQPDGDEEELCFLPGSEVISLPSPFLSEIADLGESSSHVKAEDGSGSGSGSGSSSSSESERFSLRRRVTTENVPTAAAAAATGVEIGNGSSRNPSYYHHQGSGLNNEREEEEGFELISLLMACVEAIGSKNIGLINQLIDKLGSRASPKGSSPISRLIAYYTEALAIRVCRVWPQVFHITPPREFEQTDDNTTGTALRLLNDVSPIPKFIHFTANEMLLRAFEGKDMVHIIDFDIKQGLQWPSLFQSLASRANPPSHVRITGIGESKQELNETGDRLAGFAEALRLPFEFHAVVDRLEDVRLWMLHVKEQESVGVNCILQLHKTLYDGNWGALRDFLGLIRSTNPTIVVMAEQEAEHNEPRLETRVAVTLKYYAAIFDSIDASLPPESTARLKIEEMFGREIRNMIGCEGRERYERHVGFKKWKKLMEQQGGLQCVGIRDDDRELLQTQFLLKMYSSAAQGFNVTKLEEEAVCLRWEEQPVYTVSGWTAAEVSGGSCSSSFNQQT